MRLFFLFLTLISNVACATMQVDYPTHWWERIPETQRQGSWEILPHEAKNGELILSKRNELGVFSNLAYAPFKLDGIHYNSVEALWQMMKYPDFSDTNDVRMDFASEFPFTREQVYLLSGFESKRAGDAANVINKKYDLKSIISYQKKTFDYNDHAVGSEYHYQIMKRAILAKVMADKNMLRLLNQTKGLKLMPDHKQGANKPKSYFYHKILMDIRDSKID